MSVTDALYDVGKYLAKETAVKGAQKAIESDSIYSTIQNGLGIASLTTAFTAVAGAVAAPVAMTIGCSAGTTALLGIVGLGLGSACLPLAVTAGIAYVGMWAMSGEETRHNLSDTVDRVAHKNSAPAALTG